MTPFLKKIVSSLSQRRLIYLCAALFIIPVAVNYIYFFYFHHDFLGDGPFVTWFLYFLGYYLAGHLIGRESEIRIPTKFLVIGLMIAYAVTAIGFQTLSSKYSFFEGYYFYSPLSVSVVLMSLTTFILAKRYFSKFPSFKYQVSLSALGLGIYLVHPIFIILLRRMGFEAVKFNAAISIPLISIAVFLLSVGAAWIISKIPLLKKTI